MEYVGAVAPCNSFFDTAVMANYEIVRFPERIHFSKGDTLCRIKARFPICARFVDPRNEWAAIIQGGSPMAQNKKCLICQEILFDFHSGSP
jgi:hypothetical protein